MDLQQLITAIPGARCSSADPVEIAAVTDDSREVAAGSAFFAIPGLRVDGHDFVDRATAAGAVAIVAERMVETAIPVVVVPSAARALGIAAACLHGDPGSKLGLVGITGTNGKTTSTYLIEAVLTAAGRRPGVIGTVNYRLAGAVEAAPYTTPTPDLLQTQLASFVDRGATDAVLEVSSAALSMSRVAGLAFDVGVFTNFSQDHLELHHSMDAYLEAKTLLFREYVKEGGACVINIDDAVAGRFIDAAKGHRIIRVSTEKKADVWVSTRRCTIDGIHATIQTPRGAIEVHSPVLIGHYNLENIATTVAVGEALGLSHEAIRVGLESMSGVPGRVERVANDRELTILVDYAHTPDALANVLAALDPLKKRRLLCVFGCGGDRDPSKRPKMGAEVARVADLAFVTSDNPRTEDPEAILEQILPGIPDPFFVHSDRKKAIYAAVCEAVPGDIVLIAGKGHEDYQILGTEKIHFDDREVAAEAAAARPQWTAIDVTNECGGRLVRGAPKALFDRIVIDSRSSGPRDLYVAIVGEIHDGHDFAAKAVEAGALGVLVGEGRSDGLDLPEAAVVIEAPDPRIALARLAHRHRLRWGVARDKPVVGITGSSGKTTVKDLTAAALRPLGCVHKPKGSLNNETGVPLTLLGLRPYHDAAVIEMGMRAVGQIDELARIVQPTIAVVVNAQVAHIGVVGSQADIVRGKSEIYGQVAPNAVGIAPAADSRLVDNANAGAVERVLTFGFEAEADVRVISAAPHSLGRTEITLEYRGSRATATIPLVGAHHASNAACAIAVAVAIDERLFERAVAALPNAKLSAMRGEIEVIGGRNVIIDCYNANPASMRAALTSVASLAAQHRAIAVVGDMLELGDASVDYHRDVGHQAVELGVSATFAIGTLGREIAAGAKERGGLAVARDDIDELAREVWIETKPGDWILVKASRGMRLERIVDRFRKLATAEEDQH